MFYQSPAIVDHLVCFQVLTIIKRKHNENNLPMLDPDISHRIAEFKREAKRIKNEEKMLSEAIKDEMELKLIRQIKTDELTISYIMPTYNEVFDLERFRLDHPDLYDEYIVIKEKASSVRITPKKKNED